MSGAEPHAPAPSGLVRLEGFHAIKHALRFGAEVVEVRTSGRDALEKLAAELAPDVAEALLGLAREEPGSYPPTGVVGRAKRPAFALAPPSDRPTVLLDHPRHLGNVGAAVRVAAAADAAAVLVTGDADPWHPQAVRGAAGLQFALPVGSVALDGLPPGPLVALDPEGDPLDSVPPGAILAFGSERRGLSKELLERADARVALPMRPGVSSLNLATAVAATLYALRLHDPTRSASGSG